MSPLCVLHVAPVSWGAISGLSTAVQGLLQAQARRAELRPALLCTSGQPLPPGAAPPGYPVFLARAGQAGRLVRSLPGPFARPDLLLLHSTYVPLHVAVALEAAARRIPYVVVPHGGLTRGVQANRHLKKALVNAAFFRALVHRARAVQFLSQREAEDSAGWGKDAFVVGNGTQLPEPAQLARPGGGPALRFVFLGRLDPVQKGLDVLLEAWGALRGPLAARRAQLQLWGPDHRGGEAALRARIQALGLADAVHLCGTTTGAAKEAVLQGADVFLHPSRFEGHPMAVLEALAYGVPCVVTPGTGLAQEVAEAQAGWAVEASAQGLEGALRAVLAADAAGLQERGARARALAVQRFSWDAMTQQVLRHYQRLVAAPAGPRAAAGRRRAQELAP